MSNTIKVSVLGDVRDINRKMGQVTNQLGGFQKTAGKIGTLAKGLFAGFVVGKAVDGIKSVVSAASDAQQSLGATETVFGKYSQSVIANSQKAATAIGLSANEYRELSNVTGALLSGAGMPLKRVAGLTDDINKRAADMAATFGGSTKDAVQAISSLMKGEADPIERYGVSIKQSDVNARLAAQGLDNLTGEAKKQAEMQARLDLMMQKTNKTQGAFKKETNTLAHQQQVLGAQWENLKATLGTALLPIITKVFMVINENFVPAFKAIGDAVGPVVAKVKEFFSGVGSGSGTMTALSDFFNTQLKPAIEGIWVAFQQLWAVVSPIITQVVEAITTQWGQIQPQVSAIWESVKAIITGVLQVLQAIIRRATDVILIIWNTFGGTLLGFLTRTMGNMANFIRGAMKVIQGIIKVVLSVLKGDWKGAWNGIKQILSGAWSAIKAIVSQAINVVRSIIGLAWDAVKALTKLAWTGIKAAVSAGINAMVSVIKGIKNKITGIFSNSVNWLKNAGEKIIDGLLAPLRAGADKVRDVLQGITAMIPDWKGPADKDARLLTPAGIKIMNGLIYGIVERKKNLRGALLLITKMIGKTMNAKQYAYAYGRAERATAGYRRVLDRLHGIQKIINGQMVDARKKLEDLIKARSDYAKSVKDNVLSYGSITNLNSAFTADAMAQQLKDRIRKVKEYTALLSRLRKLGLNDAMYDQLVQAGVEGGLATATAMANGGKKAVKNFNKLQKQLGSAAGNLANKTSRDMYDTGIAAAQGLIKGLEAKTKAVRAATAKMAREMVEVIKRTLGISSPSKVFKELGVFTVEGLEIGLADTTGVRRKMAKLSEVMTDSFAPSLVTRMNANDGGRGNVAITVNVPPTADKASVGREVANALDAYYRQGGRRLAI